MEQEQEQSQTSSSKTQAQLRIEKSQVVHLIIFLLLVSTRHNTTTTTAMTPSLFPLVLNVEKKKKPKKVKNDFLNLLACNIIP